MHFSPKSLQNRFTFGHILTREVAWSIKNHKLKMVIDLWPGVRSGGQCVNKGYDNDDNDDDDDTHQG